jgi:hypothetical protein
MNLRCLIGNHHYLRKSLRYRTVRRHEGIWVLQQACSRCSAERLIEGRAAEVKARISSN